MPAGDTGSVAVAPGSVEDCNGSAEHGVAAILASAVNCLSCGGYCGGHHSSVRSLHKEVHVIPQCSRMDRGLPDALAGLCSGIHEECGESDVYLCLI